METPPIVVDRLSPATRDAYLAFFDHERGPAFADNAEWARCYCQFYRIPRALDWKAFTAGQNRVAAGASIACGEAEGYLARVQVFPPEARDASFPPEGGSALGAARRAHDAFSPEARDASFPPEARDARDAGNDPDDGGVLGPHYETVGWLHAAPRHKLPHCFERLSIAPTPLDIPAHEAAVIVCFVIAPPWRRRGVATALLDGALADLAARGVTIVDAFPFKAGDSDSPTDHYHGPASLFASRGFDVLSEHDDLTAMRKQLAPPAGLP
ncbi:MAG: GNAT family N-acetyltransferase [Betaproteobacteria bacterium]